MDSELRKGNLVFLTTLFADLFYIVKEVGEGVVVGRKMDAPPGEVEELLIEKVTKLAEEQERLLPPDLLAEIEKQRLFTLTPPRQKGEKKKRPTKKMFEGIPDKAMEEILALLGSMGGGEES